MKKFYCNGKKDFCEDHDRCSKNCRYFDCSGGEYREVPMTNADRIRAMSDVEIADWVSVNGAIKTPCDIICGGDCKAISTIEKSSIDRCKEIVMEWLQQPAEDSAND